MKSIQLNDIQYRFWIDNLLRADNAYNVAYSFCIKGSLQVCTLKQSLELLTKEYEPFHATIQQKDMHPYFFVDNKFSIQFTLQECNEVLSDTKINSIKYTSNVSYFNLLNLLVFIFLAVLNIIYKTKIHI